MRNLNKLPEIVYKTVYTLQANILTFRDMLLSVATSCILGTLKDIFELIIFI